MGIIYTIIAIVIIFKILNHISEINALNEGESLYQRQPAVYDNVYQEIFERYMDKDTFKKIIKAREPFLNKINEAIKYKSEKNFQKAIDIYTEVIKDSFGQNFIGGYVGRASIFFELGWYELARQEDQQASNMIKSFNRDKCNGFNFYIGGEKEKLIKKSYELLDEISLLRKNQEDEKYLEKLNEYLELYPNHISQLIDRINLCLKLKKEKFLSKDIETGLQIAPNPWQPVFQFEKIRYLVLYTKEYDEALKEVNTLIKNLENIYINPLIDSVFKGYVTSIEKWWIPSDYKFYYAKAYLLKAYIYRELRIYDGMKSCCDTLLNLSNNEEYKNNEIINKDLIHYLKSLASINAQCKKQGIPYSINEDEMEKATNEAYSLVVNVKEEFELHEKVNEFFILLENNNSKCENILQRINEIIELRPEKNWDWVRLKLLEIVVYAARKEKEKIRKVLSEELLQVPFSYNSSDFELIGKCFEHSNDFEGALACYMGAIELGNENVSDVVRLQQSVNRTAKMLDIVNSMNEYIESTKNFIKEQITSMNKIIMETCTKEDLLTIDGFDESKADKFLKDRQMGKKYYDIDTFANEYDLMPHQIENIQNRLIFAIKPHSKIGRRMDF